MAAFQVACTVLQAETFAKPSDVDAVQGVAAQRAKTYHTDRQASEQRTTQKCAADEGFAKVSGYLKSMVQNVHALPLSNWQHRIFGQA